MEVLAMTFKNTIRAIALLIIIFSLFILLYSCKDTNNDSEETQDKTETTSQFQNVSELDENKKNLPSQEDFLNIKEGMLYDDVTRLVGLPQRYATFGMIAVEYDLIEDNKAIVYYSHNEQGKLVVTSVNYN